MAFWSGNKLRDRLRSPSNIVQPYYPSKIDCSAYTLSLGAEAFVTPDDKDGSIKKTKKNLQKPIVEKRGSRVDRLEGGSLVIPPGQFAYLLTEETVNLPHNTMGFISLKSKLKWKGLINISGFHVDPGYNGKLIYSVYNAGPNGIHLSRGDDIFLLWIADLDEGSTTEYSYKGSGKLSIDSHLISNVNSPILSLQDLSKKVKAIEDSFKSIKIWASVIVAFIAVLSNWAKILEWFPK